MTPLSLPNMGHRSSIPWEPSDPNNNLMDDDAPQKSTYKDIESKKYLIRENSYAPYFIEDRKTEANTSNNLEDETISLSMEEKTRLYVHWRYYVIIKLLEKRFNHLFLKNMLIDLWKPKRIQFS